MSDFGIAPHANTFGEKQYEASLFSRGYYDERTFTWWTTHPYRAYTLRHLVRFVRERRITAGQSLSVIEPACGCGVNLSNLANEFNTFRYCGLDLSHQGCRVGATLGHGEYVVGDAEDIPFKDGTFDICLCIAAIHHFHRNPERFLSQMYRVLSPGGVLYIFEPEVNLELNRAQRVEEKCLKLLIPRLNGGTEFTDYGHIPQAPTEGPFNSGQAIAVLLELGMQLVLDGYSEYLTEWARHFQRGFRLAALFDRSLKPARSNGRWKTGGTKYFAILTK
jgi:SAM-dependent methyltransferase